MLNFHTKPQLERLPYGAGRPPSGPSRPLTLPRFCSALMHSPGKWVIEILVTLGCLVNLWMDVEAFRCIQLNKGLTLDSELHECVALPLVQIRDYVLGGARPASLGEAGQPGFLPFSVHFWYTCSRNQNSSKTRGTH